MVSKPNISTDTLTSLSAEFSVIIPTFNNPEMVLEIIDILGRQTLLPKEIVFCDSSSNNSIKDIVDQSNSKILLTHLNLGKAYRFDRLLNTLFSIKLVKYLFPKFKIAQGRVFPYEASNFGAKVAHFEWLAFLDASTIPSPHWLNDYWNLINTNNLDVVFGNTKYEANTSFQKLLHASIYGAKGHETAPGSIISKKQFLGGYQILEGVRSGGDIAWREKIKKNLKYSFPNKTYLTYKSLPKELISCSKKFFIYQLYGSIINIQNSVKDIYLGILLLLSIIIVPKWNSLVGWESSPLFIPNITKVYLICILLVFLIALIFSKTFFQKIKHKTFLYWSIYLSFLISIFYIVLRWNLVIAGWVETSIWFVPHITKIFISTLFFFSILYRGLYFPITHGIKMKYLFPFNWILVGLLGMYIDLIKSPGYAIGAIISIFLKDHTKISRQNGA